MPLYTYQKSTDYLKNYYRQLNYQAPTNSSSKKLPRIIFFASLALMFIGVVLIVSAVWPIISYQLFLSPQFSQKIIKPIPEQNFLPNTASASTKDQTQLPPDSIHASSWFPAAPQKLPPSSQEEIQYLVSIPKLKINNALVKIGSEDLSESMIQYGGTALPGNYGNTVIFCHSVLPQFFNPKIYNTICSTLPTLQRGDTININFDGIQYKYQVFDLIEVKPDDISVLEQHYDNFYLSLITCVPPGSYWKRLVVKAKLINDFSI
jgi:sortase A